MIKDAIKIINSITVIGIIVFIIEFITLSIWTFPLAFFKSTSTIT